MKKLLLPFLLIFSLVTALSPAAAQQATHAIRNATVSNGKFTFDVYSRSSGTPSDLRVGDIGYYINFDPSVLQFSQITNVNTRYTDSNPSGSYLPYDAGLLTDTSFFVNIIYSGTGQGELLSADPVGEMMFRVSFNILDEYQTATVTWNATDSYFFTPGAMDRTPSAFAGNITDAPLPITLTSFSATPLLDGSVALAWTTAMEVNNQEFTVQRSADAKNFSDVASLPGAGNSTQPLTYDYQDLFPLAGTSYYRLKQQDFDGTTSYSRIVAVKATGIAQPSLIIRSAQPNPFQDKTVINFGLREAATVNLTLSDPMGNVIQTAEINGLAGNNAYALSGDRLMEGIYILRLTTAGEQATFKIIKGQ